MPDVQYKSYSMLNKDDIMVYTIHSDKRGFYYKIWAPDNSYPPKYITAARYATENLAELMAQDWIELGPYV